MNVARIDVFGEDIFRNSIYIEKLDLAFSQFVVRSPSNSLMAISAGMRSDFGQLKNNLQTVGVDVAAIAALIVPHFEADEMAALPDFLSHNPALVAHAHPICAHALSDIFPIKTRILKDEVPVTINGEVIVPIHVKHVHQWDSLVVYLPRLKALFSSDIFMSFGPVENDDVTVDAMARSIEKSGYIPSLDHLARALDKIRKYDVECVFPMHGAALHAAIPGTIDGLTSYCRARA
ncbi:MAG: MBL fold metallo-hydrolase [Janthinobacterium lividum]